MRALVPKKARVEFVFPLRGMDRSMAYTKQKKLTSPDLQNVRAYEPIKGRVRGGQRPGLRKMYEEQLGAS